MQDISLWIYELGHCGLSKHWYVLIINVGFVFDYVLLISQDREMNDTHEVYVAVTNYNNRTLNVSDSYLVKY